jgi:hypothetical protein
MDFIRSFSGKTNVYTEKIKDSQFLEGNTQILQKTIPSYNSLFEIFMKLNEIEYDVLETNQISQFLLDSKMKLSSDIRIDDIDPKILSKSMIQNSLMVGKDCLTMILYLNNFYKTNCIVHNKQTDKYYQTGLRNYPSFTVSYDSNKWYLDTEISNEIQFSPLSDLQTFLTMDIQTNQIYISPLKGIQTYKLCDLETLATEHQIELRDINQKKKRKKDLYEEIKLKIIYQPI